MKELSIEEKAKRYDEAIGRARAKYSMKDQPTHQDLVNIFPELKESEDERTRKDIVFYIAANHKDDGEKARWLYWLEKQGKHAKFTNGIQVGDQVTRNEDGVLVNLSQLKRVAKKQGEQKPVIEMKTPEESLGIDSNTYNKIVDECVYGEQKPADKIEPIFNVGDKIQYLKGCGTIMTIEKIENGEYIFADNMGHTTIESGNKWHLVNTVEQNPAWSEEDELHIRELESLVKQVWATAEHGNDKDTIHKMSDLSFFLKTLKPQLKQEWSEENEEIIEKCIGAIRHSCYSHSTKMKVEKFLKSFKDRYTLKPSDEHYELEEFAKIVRGNLTGISKAVQKLFEAKYLQLTGNKMYGGFKD